MRPSQEEKSYLGQGDEGVPRRIKVHYWAGLSP